MKTRNVFVDASIFIGQNYNFKSPALESLRELADSDQARVFVTDIVVREVKAHIEDDLRKAIQATSRFRRDARIFRNLDGQPFDGMFAAIDEQQAIKELNGRFDEYLERVGTTILPTTGVPIERVFDKYFAKKAPFGDGKKKAEFPDAFSVEALETWCTENQQKMYVASTDPDLEAVCAESDNLSVFKNVAEFISTVQYHDDVLAPAIEGKVRFNLQLIFQAIKLAFEHEGFWLDDQDGDVNEVQVTDVKIGEIYVLEVNQDRAVIEMPIELKFSADVTFDDLETATYDSEDKVLIPWRTINTTLDRELEVEATLIVLHDLNDGEHLEVESVDFGTGSPSGFSITVFDEFD